MKIKKKYYSRPEVTLVPFKGKVLTNASVNVGLTDESVDVSEKSREFWGLTEDEYEFEL